MSDEIEVIEGEVMLPAKVDNRPYPKETLDEDEDDGTMVENVEKLEENIVGHRIVKCEKRQVKERGYSGLYTRDVEYFVIQLDNGIEVQLHDDGDCCAYTNLDGFLLNPNLVDHIITGVGTTDQYQTWHIYCDYGDILKLDVGWSCGNPFYYGYGFDIQVVINVDGDPALPAPRRAIEA